MNEITIGSTTYYALRKGGRHNRRPIYHAVSPHCRMALCSTEPGYSSLWAEPPASEVTCAACRDRLQRLSSRKQVA